MYGPPGIYNFLASNLLLIHSGWNPTKLKVVVYELLGGTIDPGIGQQHEQHHPQKRRFAPERRQQQQFKRRPVPFRHGHYPELFREQQSSSWGIKCWNDDKFIQIMMVFGPYKIQNHHQHQRRRTPTTTNNTFIIPTIITANDTHVVMIVLRMHFMLERTNKSLICIGRPRTTHEY